MNRYQRALYIRAGGLLNSIEPLQNVYGCSEIMQLEVGEHADFWRLIQEEDAYEPSH